MNKSIASTFDQLSSHYEKSVDTDSPYNTHYERPAMLELLPKNLNGLKVLDAGCAAGWYSFTLANKGAVITGIDISPEMIKATKRRMDGKGQFFCHDLATPLPLADNTFDIVLSSLTLHYLKDWEPTFFELSRILKKGGILLFSVHHPFMDFNHFECKNYFEKKMVVDTWHKGGEAIEVRFFRRALQEIVLDTSTFFSIETIVEPQPIESFRELNEKSFQYLMTNPHFLIVKAKKISF